MEAEEELLKANVKAYTILNDTELFLFNGPITSDSAAQLIDLVDTKSERKSNLTCFLTTLGGDPHAAYRMTRVLLRSFKKIRVLIGGPCKSAGTLMVLGASEIAFSINGELGPLDTQIIKQDELIRLNSGLEIFKSLSILTSHAFDCFEENMLQIIQRSGGAISTKTASEISSNLATGVIAPIAAQVDPNRLGSAQRAIEIAKEYGRRLAKKSKNVKDGSLDRLVEWYPDHGFVIDIEEAKELFHKVGEFNEGEQNLLSHFDRWVRDAKEKAIVLDITAMIAEREDKEDGSQHIEPQEAGGVSKHSETVQSEDTGTAEQTKSAQPASTGPTEVDTRKRSASRGV